MSRKKPKASKGKKKSAGSARLGWWSSLSDDGRRRVVRGAMLAVLLIVVLTAGGWGLYALDRHVDHLLLAECKPGLRMVYTNANAIADELYNQSKPDLDGALLPLLDRPWTDDRMCEALARRAQRVAWIEHVEAVSRRGDGMFDVICRFRIPFAMVEEGGEYYMVDRKGVRLPGVYHNDTEWLYVTGVEAAVPEAGSVWPGADVQAGLDVIAAVREERFAHQLTAVDVENYGGREQDWASHILLQTDRSQGGWIQWGSAPGEELIENSVAEKLSILNQAFRRTGRVDADEYCIGIATHPNGYTVLTGFRGT